MSITRLWWRGSADRRNCDRTRALLVPGALFALLCAFTLMARDAQAQTASPQTATQVAKTSAGGWVLIGDAGGAFGGVWMDGVGAPRVASQTGVALSLAAERTSSHRLRGGLALRLTSQPLQLSENDDQWSGGTLSDVRILGTLNAAVVSGVRYRAELEAGAGIAWLPGTQRVYPLSGISTLPTVEGGLIVYQSRRALSDLRVPPLGVFIRAGLMRVDPVPTPSGSVDATPVQAGWVTRFSVGLRVTR